MKMMYKVKIYWMISGLQQHTPKFPCAWCYGTHPFPMGELKKLAEDFNDPEGKIPHAWILSSASKDSIAKKSASSDLLPITW